MAKKKRSKKTKSTFDQRLAALLRKVREEAGLTQRELGEKLKQPQAYIHTCEHALRRVAVDEFVAWVEACEKAPAKVFREYQKRRTRVSKKTGKKRRK